MKKVAILITLLFLIIQCKKSIKEQPKYSFGAIIDNNETKSNVPLLVSAEFAKAGKGLHGGGKKDLIAPTVTIISPIVNSTVSGTVNILSSAADNIGVTSVSFYIDGISVNTDFSSPYIYQWNSTTVIDGNHFIGVIAKDAKGNASSISILVVVKNTDAPIPPIDTIPTVYPSAHIIQTPVIGNQLSLGICVPFGQAYYQMSIEERRRTGTTFYDYASNVFSPDYLYKKQVAPNCGPGVGLSLIGCYNTLVNNGTVVWTDEPYTDQSCLIPTITPTKKIKSYSQVLTADTVMMKTLLSQDHPLVFTFSPDENYVNAGVGFIWKLRGTQIYPGHCNTIVGYDDSKHAYKVANQWGTNWGDEGYILIDYKFMENVSFECYTIILE